MHVVGMPRANYACRHAPHVIKVSKRYKVDPFVLTALIRQESRWVPNKRGKAGECGLTQVIPRYYQIYRVTCKKLMRPRYSIKMGAKILRMWLTHYADNDLKVGLCAYNAGHRCKGKRPHKRGMRYAQEILDTAEKLKNALRAKVSAMIILNRGRIDFAERLQELIDEYNSGAVNVEQFFHKLMKFAQE